MGRLLLHLLRVAVKLISKADQRIPSILEVEAQHLQGKGYGAISVEVEAKAAVDFLLRRGIDVPVVLDVGANIGTYSAAVLKIAPSSIIYAFEPSSLARKRYEEKFVGNKSVKVLPFALGSTSSSATLWSDAPGSGLASLTKRRLEHFQIEFNQSETVEVVTLDSWANSTNVIPHLVKLDIEGHELDALRGGLTTIALVQVVQFEFGGCNIDTRTYFQDFWYLFIGLDFSIYRITESGPIQISHYSELDECFRTTNYLAVRN